VNASGIVTMPSGHAAGAFLCAWAAWDMKLLRIPLLLLNVLMAVAAISHGGHYLVDILAGGMVAALSIALASYISKSAAMFELATRLRQMSSRPARSVMSAAR
jgi:membrane-associated phospholipid phosphatase